MSWTARPALPAGHILTADDMDAYGDEIERLGTELWKRQSSDYTVSNTTTFSNVPDLAQAVLANTEYDVNLFIGYFSGTTPDLKLQITWPTSAVFMGAAFGQVGTWNAQIMSAASVPVFDGTGANHVCEIRGTLITLGNAGTVQLQMAQITAQVSNTTILAQSHMLLKRTT